MASSQLSVMVQPPTGRRFAADVPLRIGVAVGTFAALPYIHLQLEARKRLYPNVPLLVHDDHSPKRAELNALCTQYGADFTCNDSRHPPHKGDLTVFVSGLQWARERRLDLLVKLSRRFLPIIPWADSLAQLAIKSQYATFNSWTKTFNFGFRSECVGMAVRDWVQEQSAISARITEPGTPFVEAFIHGIARRLAQRNGEEAKTYDRTVGERPPAFSGYAVWDFMGTDRATRYPGFLWHNSSQADDYHALSREWGLPYNARDFNDPNQGFGNAPPRNLIEIAERYPRTDKRLAKHGYVRHYEEVFGSVRDRVQSVLEIGVDSGDSLRMWRDWLPSAQIIGIDNRAHSCVNEQRIRTIKGEQQDLQLVPLLRAAAPGGFDIVIDDGSHQSAHQIASFTNLFPLVKRGGWYVIEDLHASYHSRFNRDGVPSIMQFLAKALDTLNANGAWVSASTPVAGQADFSEVRFFRSIVFIRK